MAERYGPQGMALSEIQESATDPLVLDLCRHIEQLDDERWRLSAALATFADAFGECTEIPPKDKGHKVITAWLEAKKVLDG